MGAGAGLGPPAHLAGESFEEEGVRRQLRVRIVRPAPGPTGIGTLDPIPSATQGNRAKSRRLSSNFLSTDPATQQGQHPRSSFAGGPDLEGAGGFQPPGDGVGDRLREAAARAGGGR